MRRVLACALRAPRARLQSTLAKPIFFDMLHSNNAARVRLWLQLKGMTDTIETRMVTYPDLQSAEFAAVNPLKKVPALIRADGVTVFESNVILDYLEDKHRDDGPRFLPPTPEERQFVGLLNRVHDLYIASPNCTQPNFAHTQGCMYLAPFETRFSSAARAMDRPTRAAKLNEIRKQLAWLEANMAAAPYIAHETLTLADMTWFPTCVFMEFMLPRVFGWPDLFAAGAPQLPKIAAWYQMLQREHPEFAKVRDEIWGFWVQKHADGQFVEIVNETKDPAYNWAFETR